MRPAVCSARISRWRRERSPRPEWPAPMKLSRCFASPPALETGSSAASSAMSWSSVIPRRDASVSRRACASAGRSSVTVTGSTVEGTGDSPTEPSAPRSSERSTWSSCSLSAAAVKRGQVVAQIGELRKAQLAGGRWLTARASKQINVRRARRTTRMVLTRSADRSDRDRSTWNRSSLSGRAWAGSNNARALIRPAPYRRRR